MVDSRRGVDSSDHASEGGPSASRGTGTEARSSAEAAATRGAKRVAEGSEDMIRSEETARDLGRVLAGNYMTFKLGHEEYGIEILMVRELIRLLEITKVPRSREFIRGVINLRGKVIPVVDLKQKFGMEKLKETDQTVIIVVQYEVHDRPLTMGILVDEVLEVLGLDASQIGPPPDFGTARDKVPFILGIGRVDKGVVFLLDIARVLSAEETGQLASIIHSQRAST